MIINYIKKKKKYKTIKEYFCKITDSWTSSYVSLDCVIC